MKWSRAGWLRRERFSWADKLRLTWAVIYASAELLLFPSTTDTFGNVQIEAIASGLPVIAADCP